MLFSGENDFLRLCVFKKSDFSTTRKKLQNLFLASFLDFFSKYIYFDQCLTKFAKIEQLYIRFFAFLSKPKIGILSAFQFIFGQHLKAYLLSFFTFINFKKTSKKLYENILLYMTL